MTALSLVAVPGASAVDPAVIQARYDAGRDREEALLSRLPLDRAALRRARAEIAWAERLDHRPRTWRSARDVPHTPLPAGSQRARGERSTDQALASRLAVVGRGYRGWAAFWVHDLASGRTAGWNAEARFPAASTVKLGVLAAALRRYPSAPTRSPLWYDVRQLTGWSSNVATNRIVTKLGGLAPVYEAMRSLAMRASTYPGAFRAGTAASGAPKPPPLAHTRVTTAHDLGRALYALQAAAAGNRWVQRRTGLTGASARLAIQLLLDADPHGANGGVLRPVIGSVPIAQKSGWISDTRATAGIAYFAGAPKIVVVLVYRPAITTAEARGLGNRVVQLVRP